MWGIVGAGVILLVARVAQRSVQRIVVVGVAIAAKPRRHRVRARQLEAGAGVIERAIGPLNGVMAGLACRRESGGEVIHRRQGIRVVLGVAAHTCCGRQVVVVVDVAVGALTRWNGVRPGQSESGTVVVESRIEPRSRVVALIAALREVRAYVIRIRRPLIVLQMAAHTGRTRQVVIIIDVAVATLARGHGVQPGQREVGHVVVERRVRP